MRRWKRACRGTGRRFRSTSTASIARRKGVNVIQYMPTASLMTYVMGLEAAKTRPATEAERKEMQRLLHEGMDAGLCGFSIQRLGPNSVQADFDGSPMVTDTMSDEDILALAEVLRERDEGFIQITQATGDIKADLAFLEKLAATGEPADSAQRHRTGPRRCGDPSPADALDRRLRPRACRSTRSAPPAAPGSRSRSSTGICTTHRRRGVQSPPARTARSSRRCAIRELRKALVDEAEAADKRLRAIQAGVGGNPKGLIIQCVNGSAHLEQYVGKSVGDIAQQRRSTRSR